MILINRIRSEHPYPQKFIDSLPDQKILSSFCRELNRCEDLTILEEKIE